MAIRGSIAPTLTTAVRDAMLAALQTNPAAAIVGPLSVGLLKEKNFSPTPLSVLADFTSHKADFTGYADDTPALWDAANTSAPGGRGIVADSLFLATVAVPFVPNTIYGYYVFSGIDLVAYEIWPDGLEVGIGSIGDYLSLTLTVPLDAVQSA